MIIGCCLYDGAVYVLTHDGDIWRTSLDAEGWMVLDYLEPMEVPHEVAQAYAERQSS